MYIVIINNLVIIFRFELQEGDKVMAVEWSEKLVLVQKLLNSDDDHDDTAAVGFITQNPCNYDFR